MAHRLNRAARVVTLVVVTCLVCSSTGADDSDGSLKQLAGRLMQGSGSDLASAARALKKLPESKIVRVLQFAQEIAREATRIATVSGKYTLSVDISQKSGL